MHDLEAAIQARHSTRLFRPNKPVPRHLVDEALELAIHAPSNSNVQPWQVVFTTGPARDRLVKALVAEAEATDPQIPPLPAQFEHYRRDVGTLVYAAMGIARADAEARRLAVLRNWEFFGAPLAGVVCMHRELSHADSLGVGMFLQTFLLALTARGLDSCVQVSIAGYPEIVREQLGISDDMRILCGVAVGYGVKDFPANNVRPPRNPVSDNVSFLED
ncbi:oxidoreductase [Mycobacterium sp. 852013-50091_SCH5140682]|uniref:nitroreductase n=1 Tax=Mycobacterium sp. 852013-50091_SCH5140682 TaxID=1834109 RepID=UPI0007E9FBD4|nr:nitroreductase [Mycobacterium sp. 852013-50091_SCH5140682]OBB99366.1 oxidoreductase [Mycobacterium sp. 852013-50091_SCH5140682]